MLLVAVLAVLVVLVVLLVVLVVLVLVLENKRPAENRQHAGDTRETARSMDAQGVA